MYATRRIKDAFRENKDITDPEKIKTLIKRAEDSLQVMKRQVSLGQMYRHEKLVIEKNRWYSAVKEEVPSNGQANITYFTGDYAIIIVHQVL